jgi:excisionase family DNA binding protein
MHTEELSIPPQETDQLRELYRMLQLGVPKLTGPGGEEMSLPVSVYSILKEVARNMQMGRPVSIVPKREQMTTQMAANILGCSRPHLVKLLEGKEIPFQKIGMHRRVQYEDLMAYQRRRDQARRSALEGMAKDAIRDGNYVGVSISDGGSDE